MNKFQKARQVRDSVGNIISETVEKERILEEIEARRQAIRDEIKQHVAESEPWTIDIKAPTYTICQTLSKVYCFTFDKDLKNDIVDAIYMGRRMEAKLHEYFVESQACKEAKNDT